MSFIIAIIALCLMFKLTGFMFKICGKLIGGLLSLTGYLILAGILVAFFGIALFALPVLLLVGICTIVGWIVHS